MDYNSLAPEVRRQPLPILCGAERQGAGGLDRAHAMLGREPLCRSVDFALRNPRLFSSALWR